MQFSKYDLPQTHALAPQDPLTGSDFQIQTEGEEVISAAVYPALRKLFL